MELAYGCLFPRDQNTLKMCVHLMFLFQLDVRHFMLAYIYMED